MKKQKLPLFLLIAGMGLFMACSDDDVPEAEDETELITNVELTFISSYDTLVFSAVDSDGYGNGSLELSGPITLAANTDYVMYISIEDSINMEDITAEINEESDEHQFYFSFTSGLFSDPEGDGNMDSRYDALNYLDFDDNGLPVGLETEWVTGDAGQSGTFEVKLAHQPNVKSSTSESTDGETDVDVTWDITIE